MTLHRAFIDVPKAVWYSFVYSSGWNQFRWGNWWYLPFWLLIGVGLAGLAARRLPHFNRRALVVLAATAALSFLSIWMVAIDTTATAARIVFIGLPAVAVLVALGYERLRLPLLARFALPALGLLGFAVALHNDVVAAYSH